MLGGVSRVLVVAGAAVLGGAALPASDAMAGIETYVQLELEEPLEMFGFGLSLIAIPEIQGQVIESRISVTFTPGAGFDAADFSVSIFTPTEFAPDQFGGVWMIEGTDLGWSGSETVTASISTSLLAGLIFPDPEFATWEIFLAPSVGVIQELRIEHDYIPVPAPAATVLFLVAGAACTRRRRRPHIHSTRGRATHRTCTGAHS